MNDIIFINDENDYIKYNKIKPRNKIIYKKVKFVCSNCNNISIKTFRNLKFPFICTKCLQKIKADSKITKEKRKQTNIKKFGTEFASQSNICKDHLKETCLKKYGTTNVFQNDIIKNKIKETNLLKYNVENVFQSTEIKDKIKETCKKRYNKDYYTQTEDYKEKSKKTCLKKYNVESYSQTEEFKEKYKNTCLEKYGVEHNSQTEEYKEKYKNTCLEKYGVNNPAKLNYIQEKIRNTNLIKYGVEHPMYLTEVKEKIKQTSLLKYNVEHPMQNYDIYKKACKKYHASNGKIYDSRWEYLFEQYLIENNIPYIYQSNITFRWTDIDGKEHVYIPDFLLTKNKEFIEIKGDHFFDKDNNFINPYDKSEKGYANAKLKYDCMVNAGVKIYTSKELKKLNIL